MSVFKCIFLWCNIFSFFQIKSLVTFEWQLLNIFVKIAGDLCTCSMNKRKLHLYTDNNLVPRKKDIMVDFDHFKGRRFSFLSWVLSIIANCGQLAAHIWKLPPSPQTHAPLFDRPVFYSSFQDLRHHPYQGILKQPQTTLTMPFKACSASSSSLFQSQSIFNVRVTTVQSQIGQVYFSIVARPKILKGRFLKIYNSDHNKVL